MKHFISLNDLSSEQLDELLVLADQLKAQSRSHTPHKVLEGKTLGMIFTKSSTRTRVSFEVGMYQLGGQALFLSSQDIQLGRGETIEDTAKVLSRFLDAVMIRTYAHQDVLDMAKYSSIPVINGLTDFLHPCQALSDLMTVREHFGSLKGLKLAYLGDGNNVAHSLLHACALAGMHIALATPEGYDCDPKCVIAAKKKAENTGGTIMLTNDPNQACQGAHIVYTDTWISMGQEEQKQDKIPIFMPYQVNSDLMKKAAPNAIFLHCLPAYRGYEVTSEVLDGDQSKVFDQAENRLHSQKAILVTLMKD
jgi:ornithine carbamoyltransferase